MNNKSAVYVEYLTQNNCYSLFYCAIGFGILYQPIDIYRIVIKMTKIQFPKMFV